MVRVIRPSLKLIWTMKRKNDVIFMSYMVFFKCTCKFMLNKAYGSETKVCVIYLVKKNHLKQGVSALNILCLKDYFNVLADVHQPEYFQAAVGLSKW